MMKSKKMKTFLFGISCMFFGLWVVDYLFRHLLLGLIHMFTNVWTIEQKTVLLKEILPYRYMVHILFGLLFWITGVTLANLFLSDAQKTVSRKEKIENCLDTGTLVRHLEQAIK